MSSPSGLDTSESPAPANRRVRPAIWLVQKLGKVAPERKAQVQRILIRRGYQSLSKRLNATNQNCMNYGWATLEGNGKNLDLSDQPGLNLVDQVGLQLYNQVASAIDLTGKEVLEVGCGRGAGTALISSRLKAAKAVGVDLAPNSIDWCRKTHSGHGREFQVGDAENLVFPAGSFDAVVNVESSHNYPHVDRFMAEVHRVLRPGGHLLMADLRGAAELQELRDRITTAGLSIEVEEDITPNVVRSLRLSNDTREAMIEETIPKRFRHAAADFAGAVGSDVFVALDTRQMVYTRFVARKPE